MRDKQASGLPTDYKVGKEQEVENDEEAAEGMGSKFSQGVLGDVSLEMSEAYSKMLAEKCKELAEKNN